MNCNYPECTCPTDKSGNTPCKMLYRQNTGGVTMNTINKSVEELATMCTNMYADLHRLEIEIIEQGWHSNEDQHRKRFTLLDDIDTIEKLIRKKQGRQ